VDSAAGTRLLNAGAIGSAIAASICCLGPLALAVLGLGGGALLLKFEPYRPYFLIVTALFLGAAFYLTYRRARPARMRARLRLRPLNRSQGAEDRPLGRDFHRGGCRCIPVFLGSAFLILGGLS